MIRMIRMIYDIYKKYRDSQLTLIGTGGYGSVYKIADTDIVVKYSIHQGFSERLSWQNEYNGIEEEPSDEEEKLAFISDVKYEVDTQNLVHYRINAIDGTPVTPHVLNAYVLSQRDTGKLFSYIFMEYIKGIPFSKIINDDRDGQLIVNLQYNTIPIYHSLKTQVENILSNLHALNISHNDLLMDNIIVQFTKEKLPIVKIIDFGQASPLHLSIYLYAKRARSGKRPDEETYRNVISLLEKGIEITKENIEESKINQWRFCKNVKNNRKSIKRKSVKQKMKSERKKSFKK